MQLLKPLYLMAFALACATPVAAQETQEAAEAAPVPITAENAEVGQAYPKDTFGDWRTRCIRAPLGQEDRCEMFVVMVNPDGQPVAEFFVGKVQNAQNEVVALGRVLTPVEMLLPPGVEVAVDGAPAGRIPYLFCTRRFCQAEIGLRDKDVTVFKRGNEATLTGVALVTDPPSPVTFNVSLTGFTAAFDSLK